MRARRTSRVPTGAALSVPGQPEVAVPLPTKGATLRGVEGITDRQMRDNDDDVVRRVAAETIPVTDDGQPAAVIGPPLNDSLADLAASGQIREAVNSAARLTSIKRTKSPRTTAEIIAGTGGR